MNLAMSLTGMAAAGLLFVSTAVPAESASVRTLSFSPQGSTFSVKTKTRSLLSSTLVDRKLSKKKKKRGGGVGNSSIVKPAGGALGSTGTPGGPNATIGVSTAAFTQTIGGQGANPTANGNTAKVEFGGSGSVSKSYLQFMGADPVNFALPLDGTVDFAIANLYHFNGQVVEGTGINSAKLSFSLMFGTIALPIILDLNHFDRNGAQPDMLEVINPPVNVMLPADALGPSSMAMLSILGFSRTGPADLLKFTEEGAIGAFTIFGRLTVTPVPVPAALPLFVTGVAALAFAARRRRTANG